MGSVMGGTLQGQMGMHCAAAVIQVWDFDCYPRINGSHSSVSGGGSKGKQERKEENPLGKTFQ